MTIEKVIKYILYTPYNTNRAILTSILKQLITSYGGNPDNPVEPGPDTPDKDVIYDGGVEN